MCIFKSLLLRYLKKLDLRFIDRLKYQYFITLNMNSNKWTLNKFSNFKRFAMFKVLNFWQTAIVKKKGKQYRINSKSLRLVHELLLIKNRKLSVILRFWQKSTIFFTMFRNLKLSSGSFAHWNEKGFVKINF